MDAAMDEIIKNIIHIDKSAVEIKKRVEAEVIEREARINEELDGMEEEILSKAKKRAEEERINRLNLVNQEVLALTGRARKKAEEMDRIYEGNKSMLISEIFNEIVNR